MQTHTSKENSALPERGLLTAINGDCWTFSSTNWFIYNIRSSCESTSNVCDSS